MPVDADTDRLNTLLSVVDSAVDSDDTLVELDTDRLATVLSVVDSPLDSDA